MQPMVLLTKIDRLGGNHSIGDVLKSAELRDLKQVRSAS